MPKTMQTRRVVWKPRPSPNPDAPLVERVLQARGIQSPEGFLAAPLTTLQDPSSIPDLDRAAKRIAQAANTNTHIVIYGDYDVDGITAASILYHTIKNAWHAANVTTYLPHRLQEGYGLNTEAITTLANNGAQLIVSVDCGITAVEQAKHAKKLGVDLIITDHHTPPETPNLLPDAYAIVHPTKPGEPHAFEHLCGAAVAYKLAWRLCTIASGTEKTHPKLRALLLELLALAALGTIADVVPLIGENRVLAKHGLGRVRSTSIEGLTALIDACGLAGERIAEEDVGFKLAPRINAAGRLGHAREALELLTTATGPRATEIASTLSKTNDQRRIIERKTFAEACDQLEDDQHAAIVLESKNWHRGVVGIVCSRLVEKYDRPAILLQNDNGVCAGSARSVDGIDLHAALAQCSDLFTSFGGHAMAAGLSLPADHVPELRERLSDIIAQAMPDERVRDYDCDAHIAELTTREVARLEQLAPFGRENPRPKVMLKNVRISAPPQTFGAEQKHLSILIGDAASPMKVIGWGWAHNCGRFRPGVTLDLVVEPRVSTWNGRTRTEPVLVDVVGS